MEIQFNKNDRVSITLTDGNSYEGDVKRYSESTQKLTLTNITQNPGSIKVVGCRHFQISEICDMKVHGLPQPAVCNESVTDETLESRKSRTSQECIRPMKISDSEYSKILNLQQSFKYFYSATSDFYYSMSLLKNSSIIGIHAKDASLARFKRASVIVVATNSNVFIFDLDRMGDQVFDKGLRDVLQSPSIIKVVHDCRLLSDCLFHKHLVSIVNVRDTEAEDIISTYHEHNVLRKHSRQFSYLVQVYLGISSEALNENMLDDTWSERPLSVNHQKFLASYASLLIPVHYAIQGKSLGRMIEASNIYNEYLRNSDIDVPGKQNFNHILYDQILRLVRPKNTSSETIKTDSDS